MGIFDIIKNKSSKSPQYEPVDTPIEGYKMTNLFKNVSVSRMGKIPDDTRIGNRVALMYESASKYVNANIALLLVPQKKIFGHINDQIIKEITRCIKNSDKTVARITYFSKNVYEYDATVDIAFFKKIK